jgi:hypothetical protein
LASALSSKRNLPNLSLGRFLSQIGSAGANSGVREVGKDPIHAETEELEIFKAWIATIVGCQIFLLVPEGENMHEQAKLVRVGNEAGWFLRRSLRR